MFCSTVLGYEIEVMYNKDIDQNYVEKNIEYFNNLDSIFLEKICAALKRYFDAYYKINPDLSEDFADELIEEYKTNSTSILKYIDIGIYAFDKYSPENENVPVLNLTGDCERNVDEQITILAKDNQLVYVGFFFYISKKPFFEERNNHDMKKRAISEEMMRDLLSGKLSSLLRAVQNDDTLCMELRGSSVNIYYRGGSLFKITENKCKSVENYQIVFDSGYGIENNPSIEEAANQIPQYKQAMDVWFHKNPKDEREFQQFIVRTNNRNRRISNSTDYYIADMEYAETNGMNARFDMVALKWRSIGSERKKLEVPSLAFIELKYGDDALKGSASIKKHLDDLKDFLSCSENLGGFAKDMTEVFRQKCKLGLVEGLQENQYKLTISPSNPEVIFIFAEHKPASRILKGVLNDINPSDYSFPISIASASMMGCGLYEDCMWTIKEFLYKEKESEK